MRLMGITAFNPHMFSGGFHVYAMLCQDEGGPLYIKFGRSRRIGKRLTELRTSCPIPAKWFCTVDALNHLKQANLERSLHRHFKPRRITSEWFKFDASDPNDKKAFNNGSRVCFDNCGLTKVYWDKVSVPALDAYNKNRSLQYLKSIKTSREAHFAKINGLAKDRKEYAKYRDG